MFSKYLGDYTPDHHGHKKTQTEKDRERNAPIVGCQYYPSSDIGRDGAANPKALGGNSEHHGLAPEEHAAYHGKEHCLLHGFAQAQDDPVAKHVDESKRENSQKSGDGIDDHPNQERRFSIPTVDEVPRRNARKTQTKCKYSR